MDGLNERRSNLRREETMLDSKTRNCKILVSLPESLAREERSLHVMDATRVITEIGEWLGKEVVCR